MTVDLHLSEALVFLLYISFYVHFDDLKVYDIKIYPSINLVIYNKTPRCSCHDGHGSSLKTFVV